MTTSFDFPKVAESDPSDVAAAIETAQVLWRRGDLHEALRWVRRAAEAAETEGDDMRALSLARAAADLQEQFRPSPSQPPPAVAASQRAPARVSAPPPASSPTASRSVPPSARASSPPAARASAAPARAAVDFAAELNVPLASTLEPWVPREERGAAEARRPSTKPEPAAARVERKPAPAPAPAPARIELKPEPVVARSESVVTPKAPAVAPPPPSIPETERRVQRSDVRTAARVSVTASASSPGSYAVTLLGEGERPANGAFEALLVPLTRDVDFS